MTTEDATPAAELAIVPQREVEVNFYGDLIPVAQAADGALYVPIRPITTFLGLSFGSQRNRIRDDRNLAPQVRSVLWMGKDGKRYDMLALPLDMLPGWLFLISSNRLRAEIAAKLDRYRAECFRVLWQAFRSDMQAAVPAVETGLTPAQLTLEMATAIQHLAQQQVDFESRLSGVAGRQEVMADYLRGFIQQTNTRLQQADQRLTALEVQLSSGATLTEAQAAEVQLAVKAVGQALVGQGDRNGYQKVYSELYRRYAIGAYRNLPAARYQEALDWLHGWYREVAGDGPQQGRLL